MVHLGDSDFAAGLSQDFGWIIIGCAPETIGEHHAALLAAFLRKRPLLAVARSTESGSRFGALAGAGCSAGSIGGDRLRWQGRGQAGDGPCGARSGPRDFGLGHVDGEPVVAAARIGSEVLVTLGLHPSAARDEHGFVTVLLRQTLTYGAQRPVAWYDFTNTLLLRMDDPGGAQNVHSREWYHPKIAEQDRAAIAAVLQRHGGRLSIGYTAGWVDDGDAHRGDLSVGGGKVDRIPGAVHPSPLALYHDRNGHAPGTVHDYRPEFRGISRLRAARLAEVELHGNTHLHPDTAAWSTAEDRYEEGHDWFRELGRAPVAAIAARPPERHPLRLGCGWLQPFFGVRPTTLICPDDQWTDAALEVALDLGLDLVVSYYLALRDGDRFCWAQHICAPYLDKPAQDWFDAGLPVVGYFHDRSRRWRGLIGLRVGSTVGARRAPGT